MKNLVSSLVAVLSTTVCLVTSAQANEVTGVRCPAGTDAEISNGNKTLKCSKNKTYRLASICSPVAFGPSGMTANTRIVMEPQGLDQCKAVVTGIAAPSVMAPPLPGYPPANKFSRVVKASTPDEFVATVKEYAYPEGGPLYTLGDKSKGVVCPSGFDGDRRFEGRGIRCDKVEGQARLADCDFGWTWSGTHRGDGKDVCIGVNGVGPTKPQGMTKVQFDVEDALPSVKWHLDVNAGSGGAGGASNDRWKKKVYAFPKPLN